MENNDKRKTDDNNESFREAVTDENEEVVPADDDELERVAKEILKKYRKAFEELAK